MTDPIADMLTRIRNALVVKHETVEVPASNMKKEIARLLLQEGYIVRSSRGRVATEKAYEQLGISYMKGLFK
jgi:ribosomal protein S8